MADAVQRQQPGMGNLAGSGGPASTVVSKTLKGGSLPTG